MKLQLFRATRNILPHQLCEFYAPDSNHKFGKGMYFAFGREYSEQFVARREGYAILGTFMVEVNSFVEYSSGQYQVPEDSELGRLQKLYQQVREERRQIHDTFGIKTVQENPEYALANPERQREILFETIKLNEEQRKNYENTPAWNKYNSLSELSQKIFYQFETELSKVDTVIMADDEGVYSGEISLKNPTRIDLLSFELYCDSILAKKIMNKIKIGEIKEDGIYNIPGEYAEKVSRLLIEKNN